jgi:DNA-binding winged helix-turn-helix (wHTH) protein
MDDSRTKTGIESLAMDSSNRQERPVPADFRLAEWRVQPSLNRLCRGERVVHVEPKMMDVLVFLADNAGEVVSKSEITDAVWPELFLTETVVSRSIAGLRRALGDDARNPRFIETILKRGYRLIAEVSPERPGTAARTSDRPPLRADQAAPTPGSAVPYVVGQWVRGATFYGRSAQIAEALAGNRNWLWMLGTRRIGKTSLLKQLEHLTVSSPELGYVPVFWDLQGADRPDELHRDFSDALLDAEERLEAVGVRLNEVRADDLFESLGLLRRRLQSAELRLLLLVDEVEELLHLHRQDPSLLRKLRRAMQSREGIRSVLASSARLWRLADAEGDTSPFLDGFTQPIAVGTLEDDEARDLIRQVGLPVESRPAFPDDGVERIRDVCGNHPYLIQLLCRRVLRGEDLDEAIEALAADRAVRFFFEVDFELFNESERTILRALAARPSPSLDSIGGGATDDANSLPASLKSLQDLGLVRTTPEGELFLPNRLLGRWIVETQAEP